MTSIIDSLTEEQVARLDSVAKGWNMTIAELLAVRLIEIFDDPSGLSDLKGRYLREREQKLLHRLPC